MLDVSIADGGNAGERNSEGALAGVRTTSEQGGEPEMRVLWCGCASKHGRRLSGFPAAGQLATRGALWELGP